MPNILLVVRHEIATALGKRSFWLLTFLFPIFIIAVSVLPQVLAGDELDQDPLTVLSGSAQTLGYVDASGLIKALPPDAPGTTWRRFGDEQAAATALAAGQLDQYFLIPPDFLQAGEIVAVSREFDAFGGLRQADAWNYIVDYNLVGDAAIARALVDPTAAVERVALAPDARSADTGGAGFVITFSSMFILFFIITMTAGYMLQSVAKEKENRTVEVLLLSIQPRQLMVGKVLGLGVVGLVQMLVWLVGGSFAFGRQTAGAALGGGELALTPTFLAVTLVYFLLGYLLYASMLGALGALAPNVREGAQFTFLLILPLLLPFWLNSVFMANPDGGLALAFSLFPLTAPTAMVARLSITTVPAWQLLFSLAGLALATYLFVVLAARFFRADTLLNNSSLNWRRILREFRSGA